MDSFIQVTYIESIPWPLVSNLVWATGMHTDVLLYVSFRNPCYKADGCDQHYRGACRLVHKHTHTFRTEFRVRQRKYRSLLCGVSLCISAGRGGELAICPCHEWKWIRGVCESREVKELCVFNSSSGSMNTSHSVPHERHTHTHTHTH